MGMLGKLIVRVLEGALRLAVYLFFALGKMVLQGLKGLAKGLKWMGKMIGKLVVGGFNLVVKIVKGIPWVFKKFVGVLGKIFAPAAVIGGFLWAGMGKAGAMAVKFAKAGF